MRFLYFLVFLPFVFHSYLSAQTCTIDVPSPSVGINLLTVGSIGGQTFLPCQDGEITSITIYRNDNALTASTGHQLRIGVSPEIPTGVLGTAVIETFDLPALAPTESFTITLTSPFPVSSGTFYAFEIESGGGLTMGVTNAGPSQGRQYIEAPSFTTAGALDITYLMTIRSTGSATSIPTLSEWGLILLGLSLLCAGAVWTRQSIVGGIS